jgi:cytochrome P450
LDGNEEAFEERNGKDINSISIVKPYRRHHARQSFFCNDVLRVQDAQNMSDEEAAYLAGSLLEAGTDTTSAMLVGFVQAMLVHPDVQRRAQAELDQVVGHTRLPDIGDAEKLLYLRAIVKECIR